MSAERAYEHTLDPSRQRAIAELTALVRSHYPEARFDIAPGEENPDVTHIFATVDLDDPDVVVDLVIDRMLQLQIDAGIPVYLIPIRTPERTAQVLARQREQRARPALPPSLLA